MKTPYIATQEEISKTVSELRAMIDRALNAFEDRTQGWKAMGGIQWRFRGPNGEFVGLLGYGAAFVPERAALVFDGRDNETIKLRYFQGSIGQPLTIEILPQSK